MASYFSAATISSLHPRATSCGHILPSTTRITRSRSGASRLSRQQQHHHHHHYQVPAAPSLCGLCHQRLVLARRLNHKVALVAKMKGGRRSRVLKKKVRLSRTRARAALANWDVRIELWEEDDQHQHLQHRQHQTPPPCAAGRHDSAAATIPPPPSSPSRSPSCSPSAASTSASASSSSSSSRGRRAAFDPAQQHRAPSSYRSGKRGRHSLCRSSDIYRPGRFAPDPNTVEDTSFSTWDWDEYNEVMWWRRAEERFGPQEDWPPFLLEFVDKQCDEWWRGGSNFLDELDEEERMHEEEEG